MVVLVTCKIEGDPIKNEDARVVTPLFIDFSDAQGQLTQKSVMESCRNSNPSKFLWLTLLPTRMKKIQSKIKALEWSQHYLSIFKMLEGSLLNNRKWDLEEIQNHSSFFICPSYLQE